MPKQTQHYITSSRFPSNGAFTHGFSTRAAGDLRNKDLRASFLSDDFQLSSEDLIMPKQVHGAKVTVVGEGDRGKVVAQSDGLVYKIGESPIALAVRVADCVPLLFIDEKAGVMGVAHAGWRGTLEGIAANTIAVMETLGATPKNITVLMGPHIGVCCYNIPKDRAQAFLRKFSSYNDIVEKRGEQDFLSLGRTNMHELVKVGVLPTHIEDVSLCTATHVSDFFSYRADSNETFGEQLAVIAYRGGA